jgi:multidrug efflux pump subunit AcrB
MTGAILGLFAARLPFGFMAFLGIISLGGVVTNHAIVLFEYALEEQRRGAQLNEALVTAGRKRLRPILLTVLLAVFGVLPQAVNGGSLWPPLAWAQIFGLLLSLVLTLVVMPSFYTLLAWKRERSGITQRTMRLEREQQASHCD